MGRFLITGGAGFIGSHLTETLLARGDDVHILDDLSTGQIANLDAARANPRLHVAVDTFANEPLLAELIDRCDAVFHLAATVGVMLIVHDPIRTIETNIRGTELVLRHAAKKKKRVLVASTSEVYGKGAKIPLAEDDDMLMGPTSKARWSYACSKAVDEFLGLAYWKAKDLPVVITRLFNTVGPRQVGQYGMVVPRFVQQALAGGPITVYGDGQQSRCFGYVGDVVPALVKLIETPEAAGQVFNVGSDQEITIQKLAEKVRDKVNPALAIVNVPYDKAYEAGFEDLKRRVPDLSKIRRVIGYAPRHSLDQILDLVIAHQKQGKGERGEGRKGSSVPPSPLTPHPSKEAAL